MAPCESEREEGRLGKISLRPPFFGTPHSEVHTRSFFLLPVLLASLTCSLASRAFASLPAFAFGFPRGAIVTVVACPFRPCCRQLRPPELPTGAGVNLFLAL